MKGKKDYESKPARLLTFLNAHWKFQSTSRWLFQWLSSQPPDTSPSSPMNFPGCYPQPNQKQQIWLPYKLHTRLRSSSASSVLASFYIAKVNSFKNNLYLFFQSNCTKRAPSTPGYQICLSSPSGPAIGGWDYVAQDLDLFLARIWLNKSFLSEQ